MFDRARYKRALEILKNFQKSSSTCMQIKLTEEEANRLERKFRFRNLVFGYNDSQINSNPKKYVIFKA